MGYSRKINTPLLRTSIFKGVNFNPNANSHTNFIQWHFIQWHINSNRPLTYLLKVIYEHKQYRFIKNYSYTNLFAVVHKSTILHFQFPLSPPKLYNCASFLLISLRNWLLNFRSVSRTSIGYCSSSTVCVYFFLIQNTLIPSEITTRKIKMKGFILILITIVHTTFFTILQKLFILRFIVTLLLVCHRTCSICILSSYRND